MGSLCLSSAPILRCESFTRIQVITLVIPTVLEAMFSTSLIVARRGTSNRQRLWLAAEGWFYLVFAILEMVSHLLPAGRKGAETFKAFDTVLAVTSFLPILCYTLFILLFARTELISMLPAQFRTTSNLMLPIFILLIGTFNQLASLVGISHDIVSPGQLPVLVGFKDAKDQFLWTFFTGVTLALLTAYQGITFTFALYRLIRAFRDKRRIEDTDADEAHPLKGTGWICLGFKLGAIETVVGFAGGTFGVALARRILRFLGRAFLCIGIVKGLDCLDDFQQVQRELALSLAKRQEYRASRIRAFISNPRLSTFRQLSPTAAAFHAAPRAPVALRRPSPLAYNTEDSPNIAQFVTIQPSNNSQLKGLYERVTIHFKNGTPALDLRFSDLEVPSIIGGKARSRSHSEPIMRSSASSDRQLNPRLTPSMLSSLGIFSDSGDEGPPTGSPLYNPHVQEPPRRMTSLSSGRESYMSPLAAVRELTPQFPVVPPRTFATSSLFYVKQGVRGFSDRGSPALSEKVDNEATTRNLSRITPTSTLSAGYMPTLPVGTADADDVLADMEIPIQTDRPMETRKSRIAERDPVEWINYDDTPSAGGSSVRVAEGLEDLSLVPLGSVQKEGVARTSSAPKGRRWSKISIGTAPKRSTPAPVMTGFTRDSTHLESSAVVPQIQPAMAGNIGSRSGHGRDVLSDLGGVGNY